MKLLCDETMTEGSSHALRKLGVPSPPPLPHSTVDLQPSRASSMDYSHRPDYRSATFLNSQLPKIAAVGCPRPAASHPPRLVPWANNDANHTAGSATIHVPPRRNTFENRVARRHTQNNGPDGSVGARLFTQAKGEAAGRGTLPMLPRTHDIYSRVSVSSSRGALNSTTMDYHGMRQRAKRKHFADALQQSVQRGCAAPRGRRVTESRSPVCYIGMSFSVVAFVALFHTRVMAPVIRCRKIHALATTEGPRAAFIIQCCWKRYRQRIRVARACAVRFLVPCMRMWLLRRHRAKESGARLLQRVLRAAQVRAWHYHLYKQTRYNKSVCVVHLFVKRWKAKKELALLMLHRDEQMVLREMCECAARRIMREERAAWMDIACGATALLALHPLVSYEAWEAEVTATTGYTPSLFTSPSLMVDATIEVSAERAPLSVNGTPQLPRADEPYQPALITEPHNAQSSGSSKEGSGAIYLQQSPLGVSEADMGSALKPGRIFTSAVKTMSVESATQQDAACLTLSVFLGARSDGSGNQTVPPVGHVCVGKDERGSAAYTKDVPVADRSHLPQLDGTCDSHSSSDEGHSLKPRGDMENNVNAHKPDSGCHPSLKTYSNAHSVPTIIEVSSSLPQLVVVAEDGPLGAEPKNDVTLLWSAGDTSLSSGTPNHRDASTFSAANNELLLPHLGRFYSTSTSDTRTGSSVSVTDANSYTFSGGLGTPLSNDPVGHCHDRRAHCSRNSMNPVAIRECHEYDGVYHSYRTHPLLPVYPAPYDPVCAAYVDLLVRTESIERKQRERHFLQELTNLLAPIHHVNHAIALSHGIPSFFAPLLLSFGDVASMSAAANLFREDQAKRKHIAESYDALPIAHLDRPLHLSAGEERRKHLLARLEMARSHLAPLQSEMSTVPPAVENPPIAVRACDRLPAGPSGPMPTSVPGSIVSSATSRAQRRRLRVVTRAPWDATLNGSDGVTSSRCGASSRHALAMSVPVLGQPMGDKPTFSARDLEPTRLDCPTHYPLGPPIPLLRTLDPIAFIRRPSPTPIPVRLSPARDTLCSPGSGNDYKRLPNLHTLQNGRGVNLCQHACYLTGDLHHEETDTSNSRRACVVPDALSLSTLALANCASVLLSPATVTAEWAPQSLCSPCTLGAAPGAKQASAGVSPQLGVLSPLRRIPSFTQPETKADRRPVAQTFLATRAPTPPPRACYTRLYGTLSTTD